MDISDIKSSKNTDTPIVCLTAYSAPMAKLIAPHVDILLVGDSVGMVLYGMENTLDVSLDMIARHTEAVRRGAPSGFIVSDMPYGTYENGKDKALFNARVLIKSGANAVKLEGGVARAETIAYLVDNDIPVMGHVGLLPQAVKLEGGYKIKGKTQDSLDALIADAKAVEQAGAFCFVLEGTIESSAQEITNAVSIPSIGIGASPACDGQVLVTEDMLGLSGGYVPQFVKVYDDLGPKIEQAVRTYKEDVQARTFPGKEYVYQAAS